MCANDRPYCVTTAPHGVDGAVGVPKTHWFIAIVGRNTEKATGERLAEMGIENYVPVQREQRVWKNGRKAWVDRVIIPTIVFVRCTEKQRREIVALPFIHRFMVNRAGTSVNGLNKPVAIVPDHEIRQLQFMVGNSDTPVTFNTKPYKKGDLVRVVRGKLAGFEGEVLRIDDKHSELVVALSFLGNARLVIDSVDVEPLEKSKK